MGVVAPHVYDVVGIDFDLCILSVLVQVVCFSPFEVKIFPIVWVFRGVAAGVVLGRSVYFQALYCAVFTLCRREGEVCY